METNCGICNRPVDEHRVDELELCTWINDEEWCLACRRFFDEHSAIQLLHCCELLEAACEAFEVSQ